MVRAVGIDLGTTNAVLSVLDEGRPVIVANADGARATPSVVAFAAPGEVLVGDRAKRQAVTNVERTVRSVKRRLGTDWTVDVDGRTYLPQEISARVLRELKRDAEAYLGEPISGAVITVPVMFYDHQVQATRDAAAIAGLEVLRIIHEPTAAALAYGLGAGADEHRVLVFDLGGGSLDVSLLEVGDGVVEVLAVAGDVDLGGDDWDQCLVDHLVGRFTARTGVDPSGDTVAMQRIREAAESAKIALSDQRWTTVSLEHLIAGPRGALHLDVTISRAEFEAMTHHLIERCELPFRQLLRDARNREHPVALADIGHVILVGGSTRIPAVRALVERLTEGRTPNDGVDPAEAVAIGAALQAGIMNGETTDVVLLNATSLSLGVATKGGVMTRLIERNSTLPLKRSEIFTTAADDQSGYVVAVYQGERPMAADNRKLGELELTGIPPAPRGVPKLEVTFDVSTGGILTVAVRDLDTGGEQTKTMTGGSALPEDEVSRMIRDAEAHSAEDDRSRERARVTSMAESVEYRLTKLRSESPAAWTDDLSDALYELRSARGGDNIEVIRVAQKQAANLLQEVGQDVGPPGRIFLSHSMQDAQAVGELYARLVAAGHAPWLAAKDLIPGQDWRREIRLALRESMLVLVCLSKRSTDRRGYLQKEIRQALDVADEVPEGHLYIVPVRLDECEIPDQLSRYHWVDLFVDGGFDTLLRSIGSASER